MFENLNIPDNISQTLSAAVKDNKISHAYMFCGKDEQLIINAAAEFASSVLCKNSPSPCGVCPSCRKAEHGTHPDIIKILPEGASITIKQIRDQLKSTIIFSPYESDRKMYIIHNADTMQKPAQNSLLKTLEEANNYAIIILLAKSKNSFYPTILSRCQIFDFGEHSFDNNIADIVFSALYNEASSDYETLLENIYTLSEENLSEVLAATACILRDIMAYNLSRNKDNVLNKEKVSHISYLSDIYSADKLKKTVDYIYDIRANASSNKKLIIQSIFLYLGI